MNLSGYDLVFEDQFDTLNVAVGDRTGWKTTYHWDNRWQAGEKQVYVDSDYGGYDVDPFSLSDGVLSIAADVAPAAIAESTGQPYTSGMLNSEGMFAIQYGYFEISAKMPEGKGFWPAFWLLSSDGAIWPPEYDIVEILGHEPDKLYATSHYLDENDVHRVDSGAFKSFDSSDGFHTYALDWSEDTVTWYYDGVKVMEAPNRVFNQSMYMLINLGVGGGWPGNPNSSTPFPSTMDIDYVRVYQREGDGHIEIQPASWRPIGVSAFSRLTDAGAKPTWSYSTVLRDGEVGRTMEGSWARYTKGNALDNYIEGSYGTYNEIWGMGGNDVLKGGDGMDLFVVRNGDGNDRIFDFSNSDGNTDKVRLEGFHFRHFDDVLPFLTETAAGVILRLDEDQALLFDGVRIADLSREQFVFTDSVDAPGGTATVKAAPTVVIGGTTVTASVDYALEPDAQIILLQTANAAGSEALALTGNRFVQTIIGNAGNNALSGGGGADTLKGLGGNDVYLVTDDKVVIVEKAGEGSDTVVASVDFKLGNGLSIERLETVNAAATGALNLTGKALGQTIIGNAGANVLNGGGGGDTLKGLGGDDVYFVSSSSDVVVEAAGNGQDTVATDASYTLGAGQSVEILQTRNANNTIALDLTGNDLAQTIIGNAASNILVGEGGDRLYGRQGNDTFIVAATADQAIESVGGGGRDTVLAKSDHTLALGSEIEVLAAFDAAARRALALTGNEFAQSLTGNAGANVITGGRGNDVVKGNGGKDVFIVRDRDGSDTIVDFGTRGDESDKALIEGFGFEKFADLSRRLTETTTGVTIRLDSDQTLTFVGVRLSDLTAAHFAFDAAASQPEPPAPEPTPTVPEPEVRTEPGATETVPERVVMVGKTATVSDSYALGPNDHITLLQTADPAGTAPVALTGNGLAQTIIGNAGNNVLGGGGGGDTLKGGRGDDLYLVTDGRAVVIESVGEGRDTVKTSVTFVLGEGKAVERLEAMDAAARTALQLTGNAMSQTMVGNAGANVFIGLGGGDTLVGLGGDDTYYVRSADDVVLEATGNGRDTVTTPGSYTLAAGQSVEVLQARDPSATLAMELAGNELAQAIIGNAGANRLTGAGGDHLWGKAGDDVFIVASAADRVSEAAAGGRDTVLARADYALAAGQEIEVLAALDPFSTTAVALAGNEFGQSITGNSAANVITGAGGRDVLDGGAGIDTVSYIEKKASVVVTLDGGAATVSVGGTAEDTIRNFENVTGGSAADVLTGDGGANVLTGRSGTDGLKGGGGNDILVGGAGTDTLTGDGGQDTFVFDADLAGRTIDRVTDFSIADDTIHLARSAFTALAELGGLSAAAFHVGSAAHDSDDRIIFNAAKGSLLYDSDGLGGAAAIQFAQLTAGLGLTFADFQVV